MNTHKAITTITLTLAALALNAPPALASATREFIGTIDNNDTPRGIAINQETGNVYITHPEAEAKGSIEITGPEGGAPTDNTPSKITGIPYEGDDINHAVLFPVAVDNSCYEHQPRLTGKACEEYDPAYGDVYTQASGGGDNKHIAKYHLNAQHVYELVGELGRQVPFRGITVDARGNIYGTAWDRKEVFEFKKVLEHVVNGGNEEIVENLEEVGIPETLERQPGFVAVDNAGDMYVSDYFETGGPSNGFLGAAKLRVDAAGNVLSEEVFAPNTKVEERQPLAVDRSTGSVLVGEPPSTAEVNAPAVGEFNSAGEEQLVFGSEDPLNGSFGTRADGPAGIAVNEATDHVYVISERDEDVDVFGPVVGPPVVEGQQPAVSSVTRTSALIGGAANPEGEHSRYFFEYVDSEEFESGASNPYAAGRQTAITELQAGHTTRTVERAPLTGLLPGRTYHYRMVVSSPSGTAYGPDETFTTLAATPPVAQTGAVVGVSATSVTLTGVIDPRGLQTSYVFEVGGDAGYGGARLFGSAGDGASEVAVSVELRYLVPGTTYHYRLTATSFDGTSYGQDGTFRTPGVPAIVVQPASEPLIASPPVQFPSVAGAVAGPVGKAKPRSANSMGRKRLTRALRVCKREKHKRRSVCEAHARKKV